MSVQSLFDPLQADIRFLRIPIPALPTTFLTVRLPISGENTGLPCST